MIAFASRTGNVRYIVSKLNGELLEISPNVVIERPFLLVTYTDGLGDIPKPVEQFLKDNHTFCKGVVVSGNRNFGHHVFAGAADKIATTYAIPLVRKIDLRGFTADIEEIQRYYDEQVNV